MVLPKPTAHVAEGSYAVIVNPMNLLSQSARLKSNKNRAADAVAPYLGQPRGYSLRTNLKEAHVYSTCSITSSLIYNVPGNLYACTLFQDQIGGVHQDFHIAPD